MVSPSETSSISVQSLTDGIVSTPSAEEANIMVAIPETSSISVQSLSDGIVSTPSAGDANLMVSIPGTSYISGQSPMKSNRPKFYRTTVPLTTLYRLYLESDDYHGSRRKYLCLTSEEETVIMNHVKWRSQIGCGMDFSH